MHRYCFVMRVRPDRLDEYKRRHAEVWPDMLRALRETGWRDYSLFARDDGLVIGYLKAHDLQEAQAAMAKTAVNERWQREMSAFFVGLDGRPPDEAFEPLAEIFNLDDQLAELDGPTHP
jgi:L-rhamnose mutarotase